MTRTIPDLSLQGHHDAGLVRIRGRVIEHVLERAYRAGVDDMEMARGVGMNFNMHYDPLHDVPPARLFDEMLKLFLSGHGAITFEMLVDLQLFAPLFPASAEALEYNPTYTHTLISEALINTDLRIKQNKPVTPAFLFAALLWPALPARVLRLQERGMPPIPAMQEAAHELIAEQCQRIAIPKRFTMPIREIWDMQERLPRRSGKRADLLLDNPRFRAGYDFLLLREDAERYWKQSLWLDLSNAMDNSMLGVHPATMGGTWQALIFGFLGVLLAAPLTVVVYVMVQRIYVKTLLGKDVRVVGDG